MRRTYDELEIPGPAEMKALIAGLTPEKLATLSAPNFISENEADLIMSDRSEAVGGPFVSVDELRREFGLPRRKKTA